VFTGKVGCSFVGETNCTELLSLVHLRFPTMGLWNWHQLKLCPSPAEVFPAGVSPLGWISPTCLRADFTCADPKSAKRQSSHQGLFALLGSAHVKAA